MKKKNRTWIYPILLFSISFILAISCKKNNDNNNNNVQVTLPTVITNNVDSISQYSAQCGGTISSDGGSSITARGICWSQNNHTPSLQDVGNGTITTDGTGTGSFVSFMTGLTSYTTYYVRAYATNSAGTAYGSVLTFKTSLPPNMVADGQGNIYHTVTIGTQIWMAENLKTDCGRYIDQYPEVDWVYWEDLTYAGWCYYNYFVAGHNVLYNWWVTTDPSCICPAGWHIPSDADWTTLINYLGGNSVAGGKMKFVNPPDPPGYWNDPNTGATNESGFSGLPCGYCDVLGAFAGARTTARWWSSTENDASTAHSISLSNASASVTWNTYDKRYGLSIRCVKN